MTEHDIAAQLGIQTLYSKYCYGIDGNDPDLLAECFDADGVFAVGEREFAGHEAIRAIASRGGGRPRHHYLNLWVKEVDGNTAVSTAYFLVVDLESGQTAGYGHYDDQVRLHDDGAWRFERRQVNFHWQSEAYRSHTAAVTTTES
ncbi:MAG: nuclear transport factor 2 family protein [Ilumatobacter sp.]|jgi:hypothetical protein|uniref:nuclear transport factor 2 family protein n=1 Tax=Ilumatobacter sp. TaxID=1967498 RepID=UPI003918EACC